MSVNSYLVGQVVFNNGWHRMCPLLKITTTAFFIYCVCNTEIQGKKPMPRQFGEERSHQQARGLAFVENDFLVQLINNYSSSPSGL